MTYGFCEKKATPPTLHKNPRLPSVTTSFEEDLYLHLSRDVDFETVFTSCKDELDLELFDLELMYPDDAELAQMPFKTERTNAGQAVSSKSLRFDLDSKPKLTGEPCCAAQILNPNPAEPLTPVFPDSVALVAALCAELRKCNTAPPPATRKFSFRGTYMYSHSTDVPARTRTIASALKAEISAICGLHFHRALPAAEIPGGVTARSMGLRQVSGDGRAKPVWGVLDISVIAAGNGGWYTITVQFRLSG
ncbi:hypothetical protein C8R46DRAFT_1115602 [Mycena filopes]|nr:hypothetical protein C8R46DRAFT_1115602 [Mycena filopes]